MRSATCVNIVITKNKLTHTHTLKEAGSVMGQPDIKLKRKYNIPYEYFMFPKRSNRDDI